MNVIPTWACALWTFILAGTAHAEAAPSGWKPPQYLAHIGIHTPPATELEVVPAGGWAESQAIARCKEFCEFWALPGKYTLYCRDHTGGKRKDLSLHIKQSSRFELETGDDSARTAGLAGWIRYNANRARLKHVEDRPYPAAGTIQQLRVGVIGFGRGGLGLGGLASF